MRLGTAIRVMPTFWFALPICLLAGWYATLLYPVHGYGVAATAIGSSALPLVAPFVAGSAAWEGARLRRARLWSVPSVRSRTAVAGFAIRPAVLVGSIAVLVAVGVATVMAAAGAPDMRIIPVAIMDLAAWASIGFAPGILLPLPRGGRGSRRPGPTRAPGSLRSPPSRWERRSTCGSGSCA